MRLKIMDHTGHSTVDFEDMTVAEERFKEITGLGFIPAAPTGDGEHTLIRSFDPTLPEVLFFPHLKGG